jgi:hypothetical protein
MHTTTPTGSRSTIELPTFSSHWKPPSIFAYMPKVNVGEPAWMRVASLIGMPTSCAIVLPISSERAFMPSLIFARKAARSAGGVAAQPSNAARAAATAELASCSSPSGIRAITSSVAAEWTSIEPLPCGAVHAPLM